MRSNPLWHVTPNFALLPRIPLRRISPRGELSSTGPALLPRLAPGEQGRLAVGKRLSNKRQGATQGARNPAELTRRSIGTFCTTHQPEPLASDP